MTIRARITCITKTDRWNPHERIPHVGGTNGDGKRWRLTQADAIEGIMLRKYDLLCGAPPRSCRRRDRCQKRPRSRLPEDEE